METCLDCVRKHLAKAMCYLDESKVGPYAHYIWRAIGELGLAEDEAANEYNGFANDIRLERMKLMEFACAKGNFNIFTTHGFKYKLYLNDNSIPKLIDRASELLFIEEKGKSHG